MVYYVYSAAEVLRLRKAPPPRDLLPRLKVAAREVPEIYSIIRLPEPGHYVVNRSVSTSVHTGNSEHVSKANSLASSAKRIASGPAGPVSSDTPGTLRAAAPQLDGTGSEWKYRGRTDSEQTEVHPACAPAGTVAQKDEGFQKFYKAVVSPTHVRVTASGRIVPNNQGGPSSPARGWSQGRALGDTSPSGRSQSNNQSETTQFPFAQGYFPYGAVPGYPPGMPPPIMPAHPGYPMMPLPMAVNMAGAYAMPPQAYNPMLPGRPVPDKPAMASTSDKTAEADTQEKPKNLPISPPEQFDHSRPFWWNGRWVLPSGQPCFPYGMPPPQFPVMPMGPGFGPVFNPALHPIAARPLHPAPGLAPQVPMPQLQDPKAQASQGGSQHLAQPGTSQPTQGSTQAPHQAQFPMVQMPYPHGRVPYFGQALPGFGPPISSIRPSEITKKQIDSLRHSLKFVEDQLQYNKHQINEPDMKLKAHSYSDQIEHFQQLLESQLDFEKKSYPPLERAKDQAQSTSSISHSVEASKDSKTPVTSDGDSDLPTRQGPDESAKLATVQAKASKPKPSSRSVAETQSTNAHSDAAVAGRAANMPNGNNNASRKASSLPRNAALAPPFQPRKDANASTSSATNSTANSVGDAGFSTNGTMNGTVRKPVPELKSCLKKSRSTVNLGTPYLIGVYAPSSGDRFGITSGDFVYSRELTEDELRARHMYWGRTPRHLQKGLPKFDGKDFYPPSPVKGRSGDSSSSDQVSQIAAPETKVATTKPASDPYELLTDSPPVARRSRFGPATMSEGLMKSDSSSSGAESFLSQAPIPYEDQKVIDATMAAISSDSSEHKSSPTTSDEDKALLFRGRQAMARKKSSAQGVLQSILKKGKSSGNVAPGKLSPIAAHGVLPNYAGHATASLTPTIANTTSLRGFGTKTETNDVQLTTRAAEKRGENRHPASNLFEDHNHGASLRNTNYTR